MSDSLVGVGDPGGRRLDVDALTEEMRLADLPAEVLLAVGGADVIVGPELLRGGRFQDPELDFEAAEKETGPEKSTPDPDAKHSDD